MSAATISRLRAEYRPDGFGIGVERPRLSWVVRADTPGARQVASEIRIERESGETTTRRADGPDQVFVEWPGAPLASRERATVRVRSELSTGAWTDWSQPLEIEAGLLRQSDWTEHFVSPSVDAPAEGVRPGYLLRTTFDLPDDIVRARIHATAHGIYALEVNGERVGDQELAPGWTSYLHRLRAHSYDVTDALRAGANVLGAQLSDGWYRGRIGFHGGIWDNYGHDLALLAQLEVTTASGDTTVVPLTDRWRWSSGPVTAASLYDGERYDARLLPEGWSEPGFDAGAWNTASVLPRDQFGATIEPAVGVPVRVIESLAPQSVERRAGGRVRLDFGQNISGRLAIKVQGAAGTTVTLHHAEVLEDDELATRPLRSAPSVDSYTLRGEGVEEWTPTFTIHGFRYAEVEGWPGEFADDAVEALVIHSDMERRGWFETDNALISRLHENTVWSMRDNFVDLPTDCPQRDERLGWTGDIQVFAPAASFLYDSAGTLASWLRDVADEQGADGAVPNFVPWIECGFPRGSSAAWGDAAVIVPWTMYERGGDLGILRTQYPSMRGWVDHLSGMRDQSGLIHTGMQLGDWLDPAAPPEDPGAGRTDRYFVANAYLVHSSRLLARSAALLGEAADAEAYGELAESTAARFREEYVTSRGRVVSDTPTALSLAIVFDLLDDERHRRRAGNRLAALVREGGYRVQTGFVGTPIICDALALVGEVEVAHRLLAEESLPSWLYPVTMGATTIWERWDSMLPDGTVNPGEMTSFNHYALGAVVDFLHRVVAGLAPASPGYRDILVAPHPPATMGRASAKVVTPYGEASSSWTVDGDRFTLEVVIPSGSSAVVVLPDDAGTRHDVESGTHRFEVTLGRRRATESDAA